MTVGVWLLSRSGGAGGEAGWSCRSLPLAGRGEKPEWNESYSSGHGAATGIAVWARMGVFQFRGCFVGSKDV